MSLWYKPYTVKMGLQCVRLCVVMCLLGVTGSIDIRKVLISMSVLTMIMTLTV